MKNDAINHQTTSFLIKINANLKTQHHFLIKDVNDIYLFMSIPPHFLTSILIKLMLKILFLVVLTYVLVDATILLVTPDHGERAVGFE